MFSCELRARRKMRRHPLANLQWPLDQGSSIAFNAFAFRIARVITDSTSDHRRRANARRARAIPFWSTVPEPSADGSIFSE